MACNHCKPDCKHIVLIGKKEFCGVCPGRTGLHQIIRSQGVSSQRWRNCTFCRHYTKDWTCKRCTECLTGDELPNFEVDPWIENDAWYLYMKNTKENQP